MRDTSKRNFIAGEWVAGATSKENRTRAIPTTSSPCTRRPTPCRSTPRRTRRGPVVSQSQFDQDLRYIDIGREEGARLVIGGERVSCHAGGHERGYFFSPALFVDTTPRMRINREEIFGPVASVIQVADYEEALAAANDTPFGLAAGVATTSLKYATHFKRFSQAGMVMVNLPTAGVDYHVPFGGRKASSHGSREQGRYAQEFYTIVKTAYTNAS